MTASFKSRFRFKFLTLLLSFLIIASSASTDYNTSYNNSNVYAQTTSIARRYIRSLEGDDNDHSGHDHDQEAEASSSTSKPWGQMIGFTLLINLATLSGVVFFLPLKKCGDVNSKHWLDVLIPSFASGALLATSVFLVIPEGMFLIQKYLNEQQEASDNHDGHEGHNHVRWLQEDDHDDHSGEFTPDAIWRFGAALLGGFMLPMILEMIFPTHHHDHDHDHHHYRPHHPVETETAVEKFQDEENSDETKNAEDKAQNEENEEQEIETNKPLILSIVIGDAFHNFCDGIFVAIGLAQCDSTTAYTIVGITLYHEIAQEIADYFLLTKHAGLKPFYALLLNFIAGLSVMMGGIVVLASDVSDLLIGVVLSLAAGVYTYIATCECLPRVTAAVRGRKERLGSIVVFVVGVVPIGLALLNHSHCDAGEGHEGHNH